MDWSDKLIEAGITFSDKKGKLAALLTKGQQPFLFCCPIY